MCPAGWLLQAAVRLPEGGAMAEETPMRTKLMAAAGLVTVSTSVGVLYKVSQRQGGGFQYSTTSAICIAEFVKLCMSSTFHFRDSRFANSHSRIGAAWASAKSQLNFQVIKHIWLLAFLYTANNQLSFYVYRLADPGTIFLFKAGSTMIVATIQVVFRVKTFSLAQWKAMLLQGIGMLIVQYNPRILSGRYEPLAYALMALSTTFTALTTVRNEYLVKNFKVDLNVQNAVLYSGGCCMNLFAFFCLPNPNSAQAAIGFFHGYDNPWALGVVFSNAMIGLAITAVYKYANAVIKCIASDVSAVLLCIISSIFFELEPSVTMWFGVMVVCFAVHMYTAASAAPAQPAKPSSKAPDSSSDAAAPLEEKEEEAQLQPGRRRARRSPREEGGTAGLEKDGGGELAAAGPKVKST